MPFIGFLHLSDEMPTLFYQGICFQWLDGRFLCIIKHPMRFFYKNVLDVLFEKITNDRGFAKRFIKNSALFT